MEQQEQKVVINLNDVATVVQLIDVVSQRGGFQGNELAGVGMLRNKLEAFVRQNAPQQQAPANDDVDVAVPPQGPLADKVVN
jgi:glutamate synthase domain-containing protein 1